MAPIVNPTATIDLLKRHDLSLTKRLGQHFLVDGNVLRTILEAADVTPGETILEVGPGIGTLTEALLGKGAKVTAVEIDPRLHAILSEEFKESIESDDLMLVAADALSVLGPHDIAGTSPTKLVANLPYNIAPPLMVEYWSRFPSLKQMTVMVQKEAADRVLASPGIKAYGALTVKLRSLCRGRRVTSVSRRSFLPPPRVDSTVIQLDRVDLTLDTSRLFPLIEASFSSRRKTIRNNLLSSRASELIGRSIPADALDASFETVGLTGGERAESLDSSQFEALRNAIQAHRDFPGVGELD